MRVTGWLLLALVVALLSPTACFANAEIEGTVVIVGENSPVRHARIELFLGESMSAIEAMADDDGKFAFTQVSRATYRVIVSAPGYETLYDTSILPGAVPLVYQLKRSRSTANPRNDSVVSVQDLRMPAKVERTFKKGTNLLLKGQVEASLPYFQKAIHEAPSYFRSYHNLGLAHYQMGKLDEAAQDFQESIDLSNGGYAPSIFGLSMVFYEKSDYQKAEALLERGLEVMPDSGIGKYCMGLVQYSLGHIDDAERSARDAVRLDPGEADAYVLLARIHQQRHNPYAVIADLEPYMSINPNGALHADAQHMLQQAHQEVSKLSAAMN